MKRDLVVQLRMSEDELKILEACTRNATLIKNKSINKSDVIRFALQLYYCTTQDECRRKGFVYEK